MLSDKRKKISATGILTSNIIAIDDHTLEWLQAVDFDLAALGRGIGITHDHRAKATITIELVEEPCMICGRPTQGDRICQNCGRAICDECAKTEDPQRYCPVCQVLKQPSRPVPQ
jgi:hypothetical protein